MNLSNLNCILHFAITRGWALVALMLWATAAMPTRGELVTYDQAAPLGLERAWFTQVGLDRSRHRVSSWLLYYDRLYAVTTAGSVHAIDTETGKTLWSVQIGQPYHPALGPGANDKYLSIVSGSKLILLDRQDGRLIWSRQIGSAPSSGPALNERHVFVAMIDGHVEGYLLDNPHKTAWHNQSMGRTFFSPTATARSISWPTDLGYLYVCRTYPLGVLYRLETGDEIIASAVCMEPYLIVGSLDSYLYCIHELSGNEHWRYPTGYPITSSPAVVGKRVYVASQQPMLHALDAGTGQPVWTAAGITQFVAQGKDRVYGIDRNGNLQVLDAKTGGLVGQLKIDNRLQTTNKPTAMTNDQTDRIFLVSDIGLVQCLHETGVAEPTIYRKRIIAETKQTESPDDKKSPFEAEIPFAGEAPPAAAEPRPADAGAFQTEDTPAEETPPNDDPFGDFSSPFGE